MLTQSRGVKTKRLLNGSRHGPAAESRPERLMVLARRVDKSSNPNLVQKELRPALKKTLAIRVRKRSYTHYRNRVS